MKRARHPRRRVALLIASAFAHGRGILLGIARYGRSLGHWSTFLHTRGLGSHIPSWFAGWQGDGVIARIETSEAARCLSRRRIPVIDVRGHFDLGVPVIETDDVAVARFAFDHFMERGFRQLAFAGFRRIDYSERRRRNFQTLVQGRRLPLHVYEAPTPAHPVPASLYDQHAQRFAADLIDWVRELPKPVAIFACNDVCGKQVLNACLEAGVAVPEDVAVLGVDDDAVFCDLAVPPLSSIALDTERIGYLAAQWLEQMMDGAEAPPPRTQVAPLRVVCRRSTDSIAVDDPDVAAALRFIREHAAEEIGVTEVVAAAALSRRTLERRFQERLGRSPHDEIMRERIRRAQQLLRDTDLPLRTIAHRTGFTHAEYMSAVFRRRTGQQPSQFRAAARLQAP
jgi:LacI family transcriptional regulator